MRDELRTLAEGVKSGDRASVARALNRVEDRRHEAQADVGQLLTALADSPRSRDGHRIGLTGPPGVGKSTLASALGRALRAGGRTVGVVAVDPSSLRSGGALLGDRARMAVDPADAGLFVRSLATGGEPGGLSWAANAAVRVLAAAFDTVLVETTGVGQSETDVVHVADSVVLVVQPGSGDALQFLKAGIMEIPDLLVVNKADLGELADRAAGDLTGALAALRGAGLQDAGETGWHTPVLLTGARDGTGIDELMDALTAHRRALGARLAERRRAGEVEWALALYRRRHGSHGIDSLGGEAAIRARLETGAARGASPVDLAADLSAELLATL